MSRPRVDVRSARRALVVAGLISLLASAAAPAQHVRGWGATVFDTAYATEQMFVEIKTGGSHALALRATGRWSLQNATTKANARRRCYLLGSPTSRSRRAGSIPLRGGATAPSSRGGTTITASATFRLCRPGSHLTSRSRRR